MDGTIEGNADSIDKLGAEDKEGRLWVSAVGTTDGVDDDSSLGVGSVVLLVASARIKQSLVWSFQVHFVVFLRHLNLDRPKQ